MGSTSTSATMYLARHSTCCSVAKVHTMRSRGVDQYSLEMVQRRPVSCMCGSVVRPALQLQGMGRLRA